MVKGVSRSVGPSTPSATQQLPSMQAGQNPHDPLTLLNSHLGFGAMAGVNPFSEFGLNPNDPNMVRIYRGGVRIGRLIQHTVPNDDELSSIYATNV